MRPVHRWILPLLSVLLAGCFAVAGWGGGGGGGPKAQDDWLLPPSPAPSASPSSRPGGGGGGRPRPDFPGNDQDRRHTANNWI